MNSFLVNESVRMPELEIPRQIHRGERVNRQALGRPDLRKKNGYNISTKVK